MTSTNEIQNRNPYDASVSDLSNGVLKIYQPTLEDIQRQVKELTSKQSALIIQLHDENISTAQVHHSTDIQDMFKKISCAQNKLVNIKKDMIYLYERSVKLKNRASKLQTQKNKEDFAKLQKQLDLKKEESLIRQVSTLNTEVNIKPV